MIRWVTALLVLSVLAACSPDTLDTIEANVNEAMTTNDEAAAPASETVYEMNAAHTFPLPWGTDITFRYPVDDEWQLSTGTRLTLFSPDGYNFLIGGTDNPQNRRNARTALDNLNQTAPIEEVQVNGKTVYISEIQSGNALAASADIDENKYVMVQMLSRLGGDLDAKRDFLVQLVASMEATPGSETTDG